MANEINIQATLTLQKYSPALQGVGNLTINQTGSKCISNVITVATGSSSAIQIEGTTPLGYLFVKNMDGGAWSLSNYVELALESSHTNVFARLRAGEFCLIPLKGVGGPAVSYARAFGAGAVDICYVAAQA